MSQKVGVHAETVALYVPLNTTRSDLQAHCTKNSTSKMKFYRGFKTYWELKYLLNCGRCSLCWWDLFYLIFPHHRPQSVHWVRMLASEFIFLRLQSLRGVFLNWNPRITGNNSYSSDWQTTLYRGYIKRSCSHVLQFPPIIAVSFSSNSLSQVTLLTTELLLQKHVALPLHHLED